MTELASTIKSETKQFLDIRADVFREIRRIAKVDADGVGVEINQGKYPSQEESAAMQKQGVSGIATIDWFNEVEWQQEPGERVMGRLGLSLEAIYPVDYFDEEPRGGLYYTIDNRQFWVDQYGAISGFGNDGIDFYVPQFVTPGARSITTLRYPENPTAMKQYNERFRLYLDDLDRANPTISHYRGWDRIFSADSAKSPRVLGGLSLAGLGLNEVIAEGTPVIEDEGNGVRIILHNQPKQGDHVGREILITEDEVITRPYWDGEDDTEPASEELLEITLELLRDASRPSIGS